MDSKQVGIRRKVLKMVEVGFTEDAVSRAYDIINMLSIVANLVVAVLMTFNSIYDNYGHILGIIEFVTIIFFGIDYVLRIWTAPELYPDLPTARAIKKYILSFSGIVDIMSFLPYFLPVFIPGGAVAFRMLRIVRIFRLFRVNAYYDSINVITQVLKSKRQQLISSVFIVLVLMMASSLCMYSIENSVQPKVFENAFSGIWWAASTLLTVGYGDIYPITVAGKALGIVITFLGCGMVAIPTGIISAGFVEQYSRLREFSENSQKSLNIIKIRVGYRDVWAGKAIRDLTLPKDMIIAVIQRDTDTIVPRGDVILREGDTVVLAAKGNKDSYTIDLLEVPLTELHPWSGNRIRDLDISRQSFIVMVQRDGASIVPRGDLKLLPGDLVILYTKKYISEATKITI